MTYEIVSLVDGSAAVKHGNVASHGYNFVIWFSRSEVCLSERKTLSGK